MSVHHLIKFGIVEYVDMQMGAELGGFFYLMRLALSIQSGTTVSTTV